MRIINQPEEASWDALSARPQIASDHLESTVRNILNRVKHGGDDALRQMTALYDGVNIQDFSVKEDELKAAAGKLKDELKKAITIAAENIAKFHALQRQQTTKVETMPGIECWRKQVPISSVGIYIPGGTAPLFSTVLMLGIPAQLAGCSEIVLCTPPSADGSVHPAILFAASLAGIKKIFKAGGAQAIAAMAYGTESIPRVSKIFGPGNQYVTKAKQMISLEGIAIDMPAGPSEVLVIADAESNPQFVAADLLSQAEHGTDSQVVLVSLSETKIAEVLKEIDRQISSVPRKALAEQSLRNSFAVYFKNECDAISFSNRYAPEHLIIHSVNDEALSEKIVNAGSVFLGPWSPESVGDYASGTNHTLPTNGTAKAYSGISLESFTKTITFQKLTKEGLRNIAHTVAVMAEAENLEAHKRAVSIRLE